MLKILPSLLIGTLLASLALEIQAANCAAGFPDDASLKEYQTLVDQALASPEVPYRLYDANGKKIPVIYITPESAAKLKPLFDHSLGFETMTRKGWPNDHGGFRYGSETVDAFIAGERQHGEINETGLSWKPLKDVITFIDKIADHIVEPAFLLNHEEMQSVELYQKARRAALFRIRFGMGNQDFYKKFDNVLSFKDVCFGFSKCTSISAQVAELQNLVKSFEEKFTAAGHFQAAEKQAFLSSATEALLAADPYNQAAMDISLLTTGKTGEALARLVNPAADQRSRELYAGYTVGLEAAQRLQKVWQTLRPGDGAQIDFNSPRLSAVLIYGPAGKAAELLNGTLRVQGTAIQFNTAQTTAHP